MFSWLKALAEMMFTDIIEDPLRNLVLPVVASVITTVTLYLL